MFLDFISKIKHNNFRTSYIFCVEHFFLKWSFYIRFIILYNIYPHWIYWSKAIEKACPSLYAFNLNKSININLLFAFSYEMSFKSILVSFKNGALLLDTHLRLNPQNCKKRVPFYDTNAFPAHSITTSEH